MAVQGLPHRTGSAAPLFYPHYFSMLSSLPPVKGMGPAGALGKRGLGHGGDLPFAKHLCAARAWVPAGLSGALSLDDLPPLVLLFCGGDVPAKSGFFVAARHLPPERGGPCAGDGSLWLSAQRHIQIHRSTPRREAGVDALCPGVFLLGDRHLGAHRGLGFFAENRLLFVPPLHGDLL